MQLHIGPSVAALLIHVGFAAIPAANAQEPAERSVGSFSSDTIVVGARPGAAGPVYRLHVYAPPDAATQSLPVLYYLDAWWWGGLPEGLARLGLLASPARMNPVILVGISLEGDAELWNRSRNRDFTPSPFQPIAKGVQMRTGGVLLDSAGTGGARQFLQFLEQTIIPTIDRRYNTRPEARGIAGHSFGGLFATYLFMERPDLFSRFLLISPSVFWGNSEVFQGVEQRRAAPRPGTRVYIGAGARELAIMRQGADSLSVALQRIANVEVRSRMYPDADHLTVIPSALLDGMLYLYGRDAQGARQR